MEHSDIISASSCMSDDDDDDDDNTKTYLRHRMPEDHTWSRPDHSSIAQNTTAGCACWTWRISGVSFELGRTSQIRQVLWRTEVESQLMMCTSSWQDPIPGAGLSGKLWRMGTTLLRTDSVVEVPRGRSCLADNRRISTCRYWNTAAVGRPLCWNTIHIVSHWDVSSILYCCLGGAAVRRRTRDRKVTGSTPGRGAIKTTRSTQPSIPPG